MTPRKRIRRTALACPACGERLIIRHSNVTGRDYLGCLRYPHCRYTEPLPVDEHLRRIKSKRLPGLETEGDEE